MTHGMDPGRMTPAERADEVGMLLSLAMMRLWLKRRTPTSADGSVRESFCRSGRIALSLGAPRALMAPSTSERS